MKSTYVVATVLLFAATASLAHQNVKNAAVKARMDAMSVIAEDMKTLASVAKQATPFDLAQSQATLNSIATHAANTPELFRAPEDDPKSEASDLIWKNFDAFTAQAVELETLATKHAMTITQLEDVGPAIAALGQTCKSCHKEFRE